MRGAGHAGNDLAWPGAEGLVWKSISRNLTFIQAELLRIVRNRSVDVAYHPSALPGLAAPLLRYWWHSAPKRYARAVLGQSRLVATCLDEHRTLARDAAATDLLWPIGAAGLRHRGGF